MTYQEAVTQAADALTRGEDANWELARLTWENTKAAGDPGSQPDRATMEQWCSDIRAEAGRRFGESTGRKYRMLWDRYGQHFSVNRPSWTDAWQEVSPRIDDQRWNSPEAFSERAAAGVKRDLAVKLMADPEVADAVIAQPEARRAVYESLNRREQSVQDRAERIRDADPISSELRGLNSLIVIDDVLQRFVRDFSENFQKIANLPERDIFSSRHFLTVRIERAQECLDRLRSYLETGKTDIDAFLDSVLKGS
jgi:hypothetical protein